MAQQEKELAIENKIQKNVLQQILDSEKRPVSAVADSTEFRNVSMVEIEQAHDINFTLLFDEGHELDEKILREQFAT